MDAYPNFKFLVLLSLLFFNLCNAALLPDSTISSKVADCLASAAVPYESQTNSSWNVDILPFNERLPYTPAAVAIPTTTKHIQAAVSCGAKLRLKVTPKCGGHSYASFGLGGENGHLVVDLSRMNSVTVDTTTNIATVGGGTVSTGTLLRVLILSRHFAESLT